MIDINSIGKIEFPNIVSEPEIACMIKTRLESVDGDVSVRLNVKAYTRYGDKIRMCLMDCVVFYKKTAVCVIEIKKRNKKYPNRNTKQIEKYSTFGPYVNLCQGVNSIDQTTAIATDIIKNNIIKQ